MALFCLCHQLRPSVDSGHREQEYLEGFLEARPVASATLNFVKRQFERLQRGGATRRSRLPREQARPRCGRNA